MNEEKVTRLLNELKNGLDISKLEDQVEKDEKVFFYAIGAMIGIWIIVGFKFYVLTFLCIIGMLFFIKSQILASKVKDLKIVLNAVMLTKSQKNLENIEKNYNEMVKDKEKTEAIITGFMTPERKKMLEDIKRETR